MKVENNTVKFLSDKADFTGDPKWIDLFSDKQKLAMFLKKFIPIFKDMSIKEIIDQSIDWGDSLPEFLLRSYKNNEEFKLNPILKGNIDILLRIPDSKQTKENEEFFVLNLYFDSSSDSDYINFKETEQKAVLYRDINVLPFTTDKSKDDFLSRIYSGTIVLNPDDEEKGKVVYENMEKVGRLDENGQMKFEYRVIEDDIVTNFRIYSVDLLES